jgi:hypothetical protein
VDSDAIRYNSGDTITADQAPNHWVTVTTSSADSSSSLRQQMQTLLFCSRKRHLFFSRWILTPLDTTLETPSPPTTVRRNGARNVLSYACAPHRGTRPGYRHYCASSQRHPAPYLCWIACWCKVHCAPVLYFHVCEKPQMHWD